MEYKKTLVILSGEQGKACVTVETSIGGSRLRCSVKPNENQSLYLAIKDGENKFVNKIGGDVIALPFAPTPDAHYMIIDARSRRAVLYGTLSKTRLWQANMTDGVMQYVPKNSEKKAEKNVFEKEMRQNPTASPHYDDEAIAQNNYFPEEYEIMPPIKSDEKAKIFRPAQNRSLSAMSRAYLLGYEEEKTTELCGFFALQKKFVLAVNPLSDGREGVPAKTSSIRKSVASVPLESVKYPSPEQTAEKSRFVTLERRRRKVVPLAADFYDEIRPKMEKLFSSAERVAILEKNMPGTKWVKIPCEKNGYYVVGIIGTRPDYVAYGMPGKNNSEAPPEELGENARWWSFDPEKPDGEGVWILYQDAVTGESVVNPF